MAILAKWQILPRKLTKLSLHAPTSKLLACLFALSAWQNDVRLAILYFITDAFHPELFNY